VKAEDSGSETESKNRTQAQAGVRGSEPDPEIHPTAQAERMQAEEEAAESSKSASWRE